MEINEKRTRNSYIDIIRGTAMLLVVLGHTMAGCTVNAEDSLLYNIIWTLQMPLFILVSGYVNRYSRKLTDAQTLKNYIVKRSISYLLPWAVWGFLIRGIVFGEENFLNIYDLLWHMDKGYWFLPTIWMINMAFGISQYISYRIRKNHELQREILFLLTYLFEMAVLLVIGLQWGTSFLGIKYVLYYMPFYYAGYLFGKIHAFLLQKKYYSYLADGLVFLSLMIWVGIIVRINLYYIGDSGIEMLLRAFTSFVGCIAVCGLIKGALVNEKAPKIYRGGIILRWAGCHSLEIYVVHGIFTALIPAGDFIEFKTPEGLALTGINYFITVSLTFLSCYFMSQNRVIQKWTFGKW